MHTHVSTTLPTIYIRKFRTKFGSKLFEIDTYASVSRTVQKNISIERENTLTQVKRELQTNAEGEYDASGLDPGAYSVTVSAPNFETVVRDKLQVEVSRAVRADFSLVPGQVSQAVEVNAGNFNVAPSVCFGGLVASSPAAANRSFDAFAIRQHLRKFKFVGALTGEIEWLRNSKVNRRS